MSHHRQTPNEGWEADDWQDADGFEKISRRDRATLPVSSQRRVARSSVRAVDGTFAGQDGPYFARCMVLVA